MYLKFKNFRNILKLQNNIMKKEEEMSVIELIDNKLKVIIELQKTPNKEEVVIQPTIENEGELFNEETQTQNQNYQNCDSASSINSHQINPVSTEETVPDVIQSEVNDVNQNQPSFLYMIKPLPKIVDQLKTFLSEDLIKKTCEVFTCNYFNF